MDNAKLSNISHLKQIWRRRQPQNSHHPARILNKCCVEGICESPLGPSKPLEPALPRPLDSRISVPMLMLEEQDHGFRCFPISQAGRYSSLPVCISPSLCSSVFGYHKVNVLDSALVTAQMHRQPLDVSLLMWMHEGAFGCVQVLLS